MAMSAASKPFTVKGTRCMCTVWFVRFGWRQRGWAWVFTATIVRIAVRMAAPYGRCRLCCPAAMAWRCAFLSIDAAATAAAADLPGLCNFVSWLKLAEAVVGARPPGRRRRSRRTRRDEHGCFAVCSSRGYFHLPNLNWEPVCELHAPYWHVRTKAQRHYVAQLQRV